MLPSHSSRPRCGGSIMPLPQQLVHAPYSIVQVVVLHVGMPQRSPLGFELQSGGSPDEPSHSSPESSEPLPQQATHDE